MEILPETFDCWYFRVKVASPFPARMEILINRSTKMWWAFKLEIDMDNKWTGRIALINQGAWDRDTFDESDAIKIVESISERDYRRPEYETHPQYT